MAKTQHVQFSDENGDIYYLENQTEDVRDASGKPLSDGGDLSEASVKFSVDTSRKLPQSGGRFKAFLGSIVKYLTDLGAAAYLAVANNDTTTQPGFVGDARVLKQHRDAINQLNSELGWTHAELQNHVTWIRVEMLYYTFKWFELDATPNAYWGGYGASINISDWLNNLDAATETKIPICTEAYDDQANPVIGTIVNNELKVAANRSCKIHACVWVLYTKSFEY